MLQNEPSVTIAKIGVDTAEYSPRREWVPERSKKPHHFKGPPMVVLRSPQRLELHVHRLPVFFRDLRLPAVEFAARLAPRPILILIFLVSTL